MEKRFGILLALTAAVLMMAGCIKDEIFNTPCPDQGTFRLAPDWRSCPDTSVLSGVCVLDVDGEMHECRLSGDGISLYLDPSAHDVCLYNQTDGLTVSDSIATVRPVDESAIEPHPGLFFTSYERIFLQADQVYVHAPVMIPRVSDVEIELKVSSRFCRPVRAVAARLSGIASGLDFRNSVLLGNASVRSDLSADVKADGTEKNFRTEFSLLGVSPDSPQIMTLVVDLEDGSRKTIESDVSRELASLGKGTVSIRLLGDLVIPIEAEPSGIILEWKKVDLEEIQAY